MHTPFHQSRSRQLRILGLTERCSRSPMLVRIGIIGCDTVLLHARRPGRAFRLISARWPSLWRSPAARSKRKIAAATIVAAFICDFARPYGGNQIKSRTQCHAASRSCARPFVIDCDRHSAAPCGSTQRPQSSLSPECHKARPKAASPMSHRASDCHWTIASACSGRGLRSL